MYYTLYVKIKRIQQIGEDKTMSELERVETGLGEECGDVAPSVYYGLFALQHRGQESCGIAVTDTYGKRKVHFRKGLGLVNEVFDEEELGKLKGNLGVGHVRYSTAGGTTGSELCERYIGDCP